MRPTRRQVLAATATSVAIAGCSGDGDETDAPADRDAGAGGGGGSDGGTESPDDTESPADTAADGTTASGTSGSDGPLVRVESHPDLGEILVDGEGMTLYNFDSDTRGEAASTCYDGCAEAWPPLTVEEESAVTAGSDVSAELTTFERDDGSLQVAADGWPLYYFASDEGPGDANGQGANDVWWVLRPDGTVVRPETTAAATDGETERTDEVGADAETTGTGADAETTTDGYEYPSVEGR